MKCLFVLSLPGPFLLSENGLFPHNRATFLYLRRCCVHGLWVRLMGIPLRWCCIYRLWVRLLGISLWCWIEMRRGLLILRWRRAHFVYALKASIAAFPTKQPARTTPLLRCKPHSDHGYDRRDGHGNKHEPCRFLYFVSVTPSGGTLDGGLRTAVPQALPAQSCSSVYNFPISHNHVSLVNAFPLPRFASSCVACSALAHPRTPTLTPSTTACMASTPQHHALCPAPFIPSTRRNSHIPAAHKQESSIPSTLTPRKASVGAESSLMVMSVPGTVKPRAPLRK